MGYERDPWGELSLKLKSIDVYYMNVAPEKSSSSARRQDIQERVNPSTGVHGGFLVVPHRVNAVTPDSETWSTAKTYFGSLPMSGSGKDDGSAANCILLSFREALRQAVGDVEGGLETKTGYVIIAEDDMILHPGFAPTLDTVMWELRKAPAMGAALHSDSLEQNVMERQARPLLFEEWPRYPANAVKSPFKTIWPGELVIPDQPVALLLKVARLRQFAALYEQRLQDWWAPLDWLLANAPFGGAGTLRLTSRNAFCRAGSGGPGELGTGSDRVEQHRVSEGGEIAELAPATHARAALAPAAFERPPVSFLEEIAWFPPAQPPELRPIPEDPKPGRKWMVVAGEKSRGLVVRSGALLASFAYRHRLEPGAWVEEMDREGDRLHYKRLHGDGPDWGWVSLRSKGRQLLTIEDPF